MKDIRLKDKAGQITAILEEIYPQAACSLQYDTPFKLLVAVRLSAQCTDAQVNRITPALFAQFPNKNAIAEAPIEEIERLIHSCGFYHTKAADIKAACTMLRDEYQGQLPDTMELLLKLPGVGRKSANLLLGDIYGQPAVVTDTHCIRISNRLGFCNATDPYKVELALRKILDPQKSSDFCHRLVLFGRDTCTARNPKCGECRLSGMCKHSTLKVNKT